MADFPSAKSGGAGLTAAQQAAVDSISGLPDGTIPVVKGGKLEASIAKQTNSTDIDVDGEIGVSRDTINLGQGLEISEDGGAIKFKDKVSGIEYFPAGIKINNDGTTGDNYTIKRTTPSTVVLQNNDDETHNSTLNAWFPVTSTRIVRKLIMRFTNAANKIRITIRKAANNTQTDGIILYQSHTDAQFAAGEGLNALATPTNTEITLANPFKIINGELVYVTIEQGANPTGTMSIKGSTETIGGITQFYPWLSQEILSEAEQTIAVVDGNTGDKNIPKWNSNSNKFEKSGLSESNTEIVSDKDFRAKKFKTKNRSIEIGPNFSVGNSADELEFITLNTGVTRTTGHTTYTSTTGTVDDEHFNTRRVWEVDSATIQSDATQNSADHIGTGANTVTGEYRAVISTAHVAFPPMVKHYFVKMASDSIGCRLQVYEGNTLTSPKIYESADDFDFEAKVGAHGRIYEQALTGTISVTSGSTTVTGVGTAFDTELKADDIIKLPNQSDVEYVVKSVESATSLTLSAETMRPLPTITASGQTFQRGHTLVRTPGGFTFKPNTQYFVRVHNKDNNVNIKGKVGALGQTGQFFFYFQRVWQDVEFPEIPTAAHNHIKHLTQVYAGMGSIAQGGTTVTATDSNFTTDFQVDDCFDLNGQTFTIKSIESNTSLTTNETATNATTNIGIYRHGDYIRWLDDASREIFKVTQQNHFIMDRNLTVKGDLNVEGTTNTVSSQTLNVANNHILVNDGYTANGAKTGGIVANYHPTTTQTTVSSGAFTAGVASTSNPTVVTVGSGTFAASDLILISGTSNNDGLFEVLSHVGTTLTIRGVGTVATVEDFTKNQFAAGTGNGTITKVNVSIIRAGTDGKWEQGRGNATGITFTNIADELTTFTEGSIPFANNSGVLTQDATNLFFKDDTNRLGVATNDPKATLHAKGSALLGERYTTAETSASVPTNFTAIASPTNLTGSSGVEYESALRLLRDGESGTKYNMTADWQLGTYAGGLSARSGMRLRMGNGNTHTPDTDVAHFYADGSASVGTLGVGITKPSVAGNHKLQIQGGGIGVHDNNARLRLSNQSGDAVDGITLRSDGNTSIANISSELAATGNHPTYRMWRYRGTLAAPTATQSNDRLGEVSFGGHDGSAGSNSAFMAAVALGNWSATNHGTRLEFHTSQQGNFPAQLAMTIEGDQSVNVTGNLNTDGALTANGVVGTNTAPFADNERLRVTASSADTQDNSRAAAIDLHGVQHPNAGRLDMVAGGNADITFWSGGFQRGTVSGATGYWGIGSDAAPTVGLDMTGTSLFGASIRNRTYTNDNSVGNFTQVKYRGSVMAPAAIQSGDFISDMRFGGYDSAQDALGLQLFATATEAWTASARGSQFTIASSKTGTTALDNAFRIDGANNSIVYENLGIGGVTPNAPLQFPNTLRNRDIVLWDTENNDHQYYGFGINGSTLRYQIDGTSSAHKFYAGSGTTTSDLLFTVQGNKKAIVEGDIQIKGGTPAAGEKLISTDANGNAEWGTSATSVVQGTNGVSLSSTFTTIATITLPRAGKYKVTGVARYSMDQKDSWSVAKLRNVTDSNDVGLSENLAWSTTAVMQVVNRTDAIITVTGSTQIDLQVATGDGAWTGTSLTDGNGRCKIMYEEL